MADFIGNYYQHVMNALISEYALGANVAYGKAESYYDEIFKNAYNAEMEICREKSAHGKRCKQPQLKHVDADSIKYSHTRRDRGNIPGKIPPEQFYGNILRPLLFDVETGKFLNTLFKSLKAHTMLHEGLREYVELNEDELDALSDKTVAEIVVGLLKMDIEAPQISAVLSQTPLSLLNKDEVVVENSACANTAESLSARFFTAGARSVVGLSDEELDSELQKLSGVFKNITKVCFENPSDALKIGKDLISDVADFVVSHVKRSNKKDVLKVKGPLGSYKNRFMQYLYIALSRRAEDFIPIYVDVASYEKAAEGDEEVDEKQFFEAFRQDVITAQEIFSENPLKKPLFILDGIRDFTCKNEYLYYSIDELIHKNNWYVVVCVDSDFTVNNQNKYDVHPIASTNYSCYVRIRSMNINRKNECIEFIRDCVDVFDVNLQCEVTPEAIYNHLVRLNFLTLDAYWLTYILSSHLDDIINRNNNIAGLYNAISLEVLGSYRLLDSAARLAYDFEYGDGDLRDVNPYHDLRWRFIRKHRSVLDFLISKEYVRRVKSLRLEEGNKPHNKKQLKIFEMVLQEYIARFVFDLIKRDEEYEHLIIKIGQDYYDELSTIGKSELSFRMTRLGNRMRKNECLRLIRRYNKEAIKDYEENAFTSNKEKANAAFLIRSLNINLIYENERSAFEYYANMLLTDKQSNEINRGFHLEYYGDKPYIPNKSLLDFEDDPTKGFKTFNRLCLILDKRIVTNDRQIFAAGIEILSFCTLLQARMTDSCRDVFDVRPFAAKCMEYIEWIVDQFEIKSIDSVVSYFNWMYCELDGFINNNRRFNRASVFNRLSDECPKSDASNIFENTDGHIYSCWLIGMLYLPDTSDIKGYNKNSILQMLLIHELWKKDSLADGVSPMELEESEAMNSLLLTGTYPESVSLSRYISLWNSIKDRDGINSRIASDIDRIQMAYRFCDSCLEDPEGFSHDTLDYWVDVIEDVETDIGKDIADILIYNNPKYSEITKAYTE